MKGITRTANLLFILSVVNVAGASAAEKAECTLEPNEGSKQVQLRDGIVANMSWSVCTRMVTDIEFSPVSQNVMNAPNIALREAANLVAELEETTGESVCPFDGDIPAAFKTRIQERDRYEFGENVPISNTDIPGWDGASVSVRREKESVKLTIRYWANP